jgi:predicted dehydrogenase
VKPLRTAIVGYGRWGRVLARAIDAHSLFDLTRICHRTAPRSDRMTPSLDDLLDDGEIAIIVVATPLATRVPIMLACLRAGKHVMAEKPLATSSREITELVETACQHKRVLFTNYIHAYGRGLERLRPEIGELGDLREIAVTLLQPGPLVQGEGVETLLGSHAAAILLRLLALGGIARDVTAISSCKQGLSNGQSLRWSWQGSCRLGPQVRFTVDLAYPLVHRRVDVIGDRAAATADLTSGVVYRLPFDRLSTLGRASALDSHPKPADDLSHVLDQVAKAITKGDCTNEVFALEIQALLEGET